MIDLHNHILPGLDDGAADWEESLRIARAAWKDGIRTIAATPHLIWDRRFNDWEKVKRLAEETEKFMKEHGFPLRIIPGTELPTRQETLDLIRTGSIPTYGDGGCVLFEPPFGRLTLEIDRFVDGFLSAGCRILLAHPERCREFQDRPERLNRYFPPDIPIQISSQSLTGEFGARAYETAETLLSCGRPAVIASDSHSWSRRPPTLSQARKVAEKLVGEEYARRMVDDNPRAVLEGLPVQPPPVVS